MVEQLSFQVEGGGSIPTSPLQLTIREISPILACYLNNRWHSRLPELDWSNVTRNRHYVCFGAYYNGDWYAVGIWSSPVNQAFNMDKTLELRRFAICGESPKYTASRMMKVMVLLIRKYLPTIRRLISYQDTDVHTGTIYKASGWQPVGKVKYRSWGVTRQRKPDQSDADKIRWELQLSNCPKQYLVNNVNHVSRHTEPGKTLEEIFPQAVQGELARQRQGARGGKTRPWGNISPGCTSPTNP